MRRVVLWLAGTMLAIAPAQAEPAATAPGAGPALWRVADADTTIYLFGTVHALPPGVDWYRGPVVAAFDAADEVIFETVEPEGAGATETAQNFVAGLMLPEGKSLRDRVPQAYRQRYDLALARSGGPGAMIDRFKPWFAAFLLGGLEPRGRGRLTTDALGVETVLSGKAREAGKTVGEIEGMEAQLSLLNAVPSPLQIRFLQEALDGIDQNELVGEELLRTWSNGDVPGLDAVTRDWPRDPEMRRVLLDRRNANWAAWIADRLEKPGTVLLAVGAAHLVGPDSVQHHLAQAAVTAERVAP